MDWKETRVDGTLRVRPWPAEAPLFLLVIVVACLMWVVLVLSIIGVLWAAGFALVLLALQLAALAHVKGSAIKVGPDQFPDLHEAAIRISARFGLEDVPDVYVMQGGGALNAFVTRFAKSHLLVLFSDLLEACGPSTAARDFILGHEIGHVRSGHLKLSWLLAPGMLVPLLGTALSRAREYTCDRFGLAASDDPAAAIRGLAILSAGPVYGMRADLRAFVRQQEDLATGLLTLGEWFSTHPPLSRRVAALEPALAAGVERGSGRVRAASLIAAAALPFVLLGAWGAARLPDYLAQTEAAWDDSWSAPDSAAATAEVSGDFEILAVFIEAEWDGRRPPESMAEVMERWREVEPDQPLPIDPFDGSPYGFDALESGYRLWSSGPDGMARTRDDLEYVTGPEVASSG